MTEPQQSAGREDGSPAARRGALVLLLLAAVLAVVSYLAYRPFLDLALLGLDTFPLIVSARILGIADLAGTFTEELMDGLYPDGHFYRPVTNLSFALDYALWRLDPRGYHLTDLAILIANATLLSAVVRRLFGPRATLAALLAGLVFALHPVQLELLPVPPRRADTLCSAFLLAALLAQPGTGKRAPLRTVVAALLALASVASKESGAIVVPLVFAWHALHAEGPLATRARLAARHTLAPLLALALFVAARTAVLGGLGGHAGSSLAALASVPELAGQYVERLLYPQPIFGKDARLAGAFTWSLAVALLLSAFAVWRWPGSSVVRERASLRGGLAFLAVWSLCVLAISSLAGRVHDWYAMLFLAPYAAFVGVLVQVGVALIRALRPLPAVLPLAAAACAVAGSLAYSSLVRDYPTWAEAGRLADEQIVRYQNLLAQSEGREGQRVVFDRFVPWLPPPQDGPGVSSAFLHAEHSLMAYTRLVYPSRRVHIDFYTGGPLPTSPGSDVLHVILYPGRASDLR